MKSRSAKVGRLFFWYAVRGAGFMETSSIF